MNQPEGVKGVQSIVRAAKVLRLVGTRFGRGCSVTDISRNADLHVATAKRILAALTQEGLLVRNEKTKHYFISYQLYLLCRNSYLALLKDELHDLLARIAKDSEDTAFLIAPMGYDALCVDRVEGNYPIRTLTFDVGDRRPLGIGAGGLAILASYEHKVTEKIIVANRDRYRRINKRSVEEIRHFVKLTRKTGYALSIGNVTPGAAAVALPLISLKGEPLAAIAIAAVEDRMTPPRRKILIDLLRRELGNIPSFTLDTIEGQ